MTGDLGLNTFTFEDFLFLSLFHFAFMTDQELVLFLIKMTLINHFVVFTRRGGLGNDSYLDPFSFILLKHKMSRICFNKETIKNE